MNIKTMLPFLTVLLASCDNQAGEYQYPPLLPSLNENSSEIHYSKEQFDQPHFPSFLIYQKLTHQDDQTSTESDPAYIKVNPRFNRLVDEKTLNQILDETGNSLTANADWIALEEKQPSKELELQSCLFWGVDQEKYRQQGYLESNSSILDDVDFQIVDYKLTNEQGQTVSLAINQPGLSFSSLSKQQDRYCQNQRFIYSLTQPKSFLSLTGQVTLKVSYPLSYNITTIQKQDIGKKYQIENNHLNVLMMENNRIDLKIDEENINENIDIGYRVNKELGQNFSTVAMPFFIYDAMRRKPGLDYQQFIAEFGELLNQWDEQRLHDKPLKPSALVIWADHNNISEFLLYYQDKKIERTFTIPVNINISNNVQ